MISLNENDFEVLKLISKGYPVQGISKKLEIRLPMIAMIRKKLKEAGLIEYEPYSGGAITTRNGEYYLEFYKKVK